MERVITIFGDIVAKFATFSEEHSFILAGLIIVTLFLIVGKIIESKNPSKEETPPEDKKITKSFEDNRETTIEAELGNKATVKESFNRNQNSTIRIS